ncbi:MAG: nuclear transport factor 2 family protein [Hyphomicrobiales bacterium]|nr:nuclear transport factor 2 family protein [Hyphomicrobiales bacterium]MCP5372194.1 nuclear transport factor 2 family protein [Hyphomicrobiales bacterium]
MDETERRAIEADCARLVARYAADADFGRFDRAAETYATDGELTIRAETYRGRAAIAGRLADKPAGEVTRHVLGPTLVEVLDAGAATGVTYVTLYRGQAADTPGPLPLAPPLLVGHYEDRFVRTGEGWRFAARHLRVTFRRRDPA